jgi:predicted nucleic acid-binding protein
MTAVVIDASAALAWMLKSQATKAADAFLLQVDDLDLVAPAIFQWEVRNVLLSFARRGLLAAADYEAAIAALDALNIRAASPLETAELPAFAEFAREARLSLVDASYLALAMELDCGLASRDTALLEAALGVAVTCIDLRAEVSP